MSDRTKQPQIEPESFESFRRSFSYGSRSDMNFKFLKGLSDEEAADFFQELLWRLGDFLNDGDPERLAAQVRAGQSLSYSREPSWTYDDGPFTPLEKPLSNSRLALLTSTGHFAAGDDPEPFGVAAMSQAEAEARIGEFLRSRPELSEIPINIPAADLQVRHGGYDVRCSQADHNVNFPIDLLREMEAAGEIQLHEKAYSFVGATAQIPLRDKVGPQWVARLQAESVEAVLLVPV